MRPALVLANVFGWPVLQLTIAWGATRIAPERFARDNGIFRLRGWEKSFYRRHLMVRRWKGMLPDGEKWVGGGFSKKRLTSKDASYLHRFVAETRRGEAAHWTMMACFPLFCIWNPIWACGVMALYAIASNVPCILVQRYNREVIMMRLMSQRARQQTDACGGPGATRNLSDEHASQ